MFGLLSREFASVVHYALELTGANKGDVEFVILFGSIADGRAKGRYSDYDIGIVFGTSSKGNRRQQLSISRDFEGAYRSKLVTGTTYDIATFQKMFLGNGDTEFLWRKRQMAKAKLLYGNQSEFEKFRKKVLNRPWRTETQIGVMKPRYINMIEYLYKMQNALENRNEQGFYLAAFVVAHNAMEFLAGLNRIDLDSENTMYQQILDESRVKPHEFKRDFLKVSGFSNTHKGSKARTLSCAKRIVKWCRNYLLDNYKLDSTFNDILKLEIYD